MQEKMVKALRLKGFDPVFFVSHLLILLLSYSIYLAPYIAPSTFPYFGFVPIFYPAIVLFNVLLIGILVLRRRLFGIIFIVLSAGLLPPLFKSYQFFGDKVEAKSDFKLLTFNVHYLRDAEVAVFEDFFRKENADVVLLQEVWWKDKKFEALKEASFSDYYHEKNTLNQVFSRYPIIEFRPIFSDLPGTTAYACYADIDTGEDTLRIINVYLEPMHINKELIKEGVNSTEHAKTNSKILKNKLTEGFLRHQKQIQELIPFIQHSPHPVILAGDLNAVPNSYEYKQISFWLRDPYIDVGRSSGTTFHDYKFPLRLDYVFHSDELLSVGYKVLRKQKISDHYPVVAELKLP